MDQFEGARFSAELDDTGIARSRSHPGEAAAPTQAATPRRAGSRPASGFGPGTVPPMTNALIHGMAVRALNAGLGGQAAIGFASVLHREGATTVACAVASCIASSLGQRVVLVDANARSPALRTACGLAPSIPGAQAGPGLAEVLAGAAPLERALCLPNSGPQGDGRLLVLPAGRTAPTLSASGGHVRSAGEDAPAGLIGPAMSHLIAALYGYADVLLFDAAPLSPYPDTTLLARHLDGMIMVLQAERVTWDASQEALQRLRDSGARVLGVVLNKRKTYIPRLLERLL